MDEPREFGAMASLALKAVSLGMGAAVIVLNVLHTVSVETQVVLLAIGLAALALASLK